MTETDYEYVSTSKIGNQVLITDIGGTDCVSVEPESVPALIQELAEVLDDDS